MLGKWIKYSRATAKQNVKMFVDKYDELIDSKNAKIKSEEEKLKYLEFDLELSLSTPHIYTIMRTKNLEDPIYYGTPVNVGHIKIEKKKVEMKILPEEMERLLNENKHINLSIDFCRKELIEIIQEKQLFLDKFWRYI